MGQEQSIENQFYYPIATELSEPSSEDFIDILTKTTEDARLKKEAEKKLKLEEFMNCELESDEGASIKWIKEMLFETAKKGENSFMVKIHALGSVHQPLAPRNMLGISYQIRDSGLFSNEECRILIRHLLTKYVRKLLVRFSIETGFVFHATNNVGERTNRLTNYCFHQRSENDYDIMEIHFVWGLPHAKTI